MKRRLLTLCSAVSLLLCGASCALWVRSYWRADCLLYWDARRLLSVESRAGYLSVEAGNFHGDRPRVYRLAPERVNAVALERRGMRAFAVRGAAGFFYARDVRPSAGIVLYPELVREGLRRPPGAVVREWFYVPFWAVVALTAAPPAVWIARAARLRGRARRGLCLRCGYDLRASPARCPECGEVAGGGVGSGA